MKQILKQFNLKIWTCDFFILLEITEKKIKTRISHATKKRDEERKKTVTKAENERKGKEREKFVFWHFLYCSSK